MTEAAGLLECWPLNVTVIGVVWPIPTITPVVMILWGLLALLQYGEGDVLAWCCADLLWILLGCCTLTVLCINGPPCGSFMNEWMP